MNAPHVTSLLIAPAKGGKLPTFADLGIDFAKLFADAVVPETLPQQLKSAELKSAEEEKPHPGPADKSEDPVLLLGLPVSIPVPQAEIPAVKTKPVEALPAVAVEAPKVKDEVQAKNPQPLPEAVLPAELAKEAAPLPAGDEMRMLVQAHDTHHAQAAAPARPAQPVAAPVGTPQWRDEFSAAVRVIAIEKLQSAEIHLNPPELGPVQVSLRMEAKEASIAFSAPQAETCLALEEALPRLRELLEESGLSLGETSVDVSGSGGFAREQAASQGRMLGMAVPATVHAEPVPAAQPARGLGLVDTFA